MILRGRSGEYATFGGVRRFDPKRLPPNPPIGMSPELTFALSSADRALARLDGATINLPNPQLFVYAFMRQEAVLSSQIEGTQASLDDLLEYESGVDTVEKTADITEVINYLDAMDWGLKQLPNLPVCLRLIKGLHLRLLKEGRGSDKTPGEFRNSQNWIGPPGCSINEAAYVPPTVENMKNCLSDWEKYINSEHATPPLIKCALVHAQFETIHPFLDGNGRLGRMIITLMLCSERILAHHILYLSLFFRQHRDQYYRLLQAIRDDGNWEDWLLFFLQGVTATSRAALQTVARVTELRERLLEFAHAKMRSKKSATLGQVLFEQPYITVTRAAELIGVTYPTANSIIEEFVDSGYLAQVRGGGRKRMFGFAPYLDILHEGAGDLTGILSGPDYLVTNTGLDAHPTPRNSASE